MLLQPHPRNPEGESGERTLSLQIDNLLDFEFMDPPRCHLNLTFLTSTDIGLKMTEFPLDQQLAKLL